MSALDFIKTHFENNREGFPHNEIEGETAWLDSMQAELLARFKETNTEWLALNQNLNAVKSRMDKRAAFLRGEFDSADGFIAVNNARIKQLDAELVALKARKQAVIAQKEATGVLTDEMRATLVSYNEEKVRLLDSRDALRAEIDARVDTEYPDEASTLVDLQPQLTEVGRVRRTIQMDLARISRWRESISTSSSALDEKDIVDLFESLAKVRYIIDTTRDVRDFSSTWFQSLLASTLGPEYEDMVSDYYR